MIKSKLCDKLGTLNVTGLKAVFDFVACCTMLISGSPRMEVLVNIGFPLNMGKPR